MVDPYMYTCTVAHENELKDMLYLTIFIRRVRFYVYTRSFEAWIGTTWHLAGRLFVNDICVRECRDS